jgi:hypothetical protein
VRGRQPDPASPSPEHVQLRTQSVESLDHNFGPSARKSPLLVHTDMYCTHCQNVLEIQEIAVNGRSDLRDDYSHHDTYSGLMGSVAAGYSLCRDLERQLSLSDRIGDIASDLLPRPLTSWWTTRTGREHGQYLITFEFSDSWLSAIELVIPSLHVRPRNTLCFLTWLRDPQREIVSHFAWR